MSDIAIRVQGLGKKYRIGQRQRYHSLRETLMRGLTAPFRRRRESSGSNGNGQSTFWALKDVSFEVPQGQVVGIIGRNGAGKSTLLKILSRITEPTEGEVDLHGRVGSLLEVGTGFHPELTGRENIYLNGAVLGMSRAEINRKFDEIVAFAEVEKFLDTPVKHYSSGMQMRLGFAVAAHLEPEILFVDEVLAVGDVQFQKRCLGKMGEVAKGGRTVLFVSHNMAAIQALCGSAIALSGGIVAANGPTKTVVDGYLTDVSRGHLVPLRDRIDRQGSGAVRFISIAFANGQCEFQTGFQCGGEAIIVLHFENRSGKILRNLRVALGINNSLGQRVLLLDSTLLGADLAEILPGKGVIRASLPRLALVPGRYDFTIYAAANGLMADWVQDAGSFEVDGGDYFGTGQLPSPGQGVFVADHAFIYEPMSTDTASSDARMAGSLPVAPSGLQGEPA
jgi:lipopolysaccharide transport system ATP-binding protein